MAEEEQKEGGATDEGGGGGVGKSKKKLLIIIIAAVVLIAGGAGAFLFMSGGSEDSTEATEGGETGEETKSSEEEVPEVGGEEGETGEKAKKEAAKKEGEESSNPNFGMTHTFKPFHLNLGNPIENHYIRLEVSIEYKGGEQQKKEIESREPQLRDAVISVTSRKTREFLLSPDGKDRLRYEMLNQINSLMTKPIENIFITDIIIE